MSYPRNLMEIAAEMESLTSGDREADHSRADDLLIETIIYQSEAASGAHGDEAERIIDAWRRLDKWYA